MSYYIVNMADAAARREARRKRILENSHNRLQLISGKNNDESYKESQRKSPIPQVFETTIATDSSEASSYPLLNGVLGTELESPQSLPSRHDVASGDGEDLNLNDFAGFRPPQVPEQTQSPLWRSLITYKYDIVILSLLLQILYGIASSFENTYFFLPLIIYTVTKLVWFPNQSYSSIANVLLLLNGMNPQRIQKILKFVHAAGCISQDLSIYLFTTICIQTLYITFKDSFVT